eukprot:1737471-Rhodomonas_salina.3
MKKGEGGGREEGGERERAIAEQRGAGTCVQGAEEEGREEGREGGREENRRRERMRRMKRMRERRGEEGPCKEGMRERSWVLLGAAGRTDRAAKNGGRTEWRENERDSVTTTTLAKCGETEPL